VVRHLFLRASFLLAVSLAGQRVAWSAPPERRPVHLSYTRESGGEQCPDESALRDSVLARLGYDPFDNRAPRILRVAVGRSGDSLIAKIELYDEAGLSQGERDMKGSGPDCTELAKALAIAVSLGIDPLSAMAASPTKAGVESAEAPPAKQGPPEPAAPQPAPTVPPQEAAARDTSIRTRFSAGAIVSFGVSPFPAAFGATLDAGLRRGFLSLDLEGAGSWAPTETIERVSVNSSLATLSLVPCVHLGIGVGCAIGGVGSLNATAFVSDRSVFADLGIRLGAEVPIGKVFYVQFHADGLGILRSEIVLDGMNKLWSTTPPLAASLGLALGVTP
jgi:hypothetical protein